MESNVPGSGTFGRFAFGVLCRGRKFGRVAGMEVNMKRVDGATGPAVREEFRERYPHRAYVQAMRSEPGQWFEFEDLPAQYATIIRAGSITAYRPMGAYESLVRGGVVRARFVGDDATPLPEPSYGKYNHELVREQTMAAEGHATIQEGWPRSYVTAVKNGGMGYAMGEWEARHVKGVGVVLKWLGPVTEDSETE